MVNYIWRASKNLSYFRELEANHFGDDVTLYLAKNLK